MKYIDIKPETNNRYIEFNRWCNNMTSKLVSIKGKKIPVNSYNKWPVTHPYNVIWWHENNGEIMTIERNNGNGKDVISFDADFTLGQALDLMERNSIDTGILTN